MDERDERRLARRRRRVLRGRLPAWVRSQPAMGYVVLGVLLLTILALAQQVSQDRAQARQAQLRTACQARYNQAFAANLHARAVLSDRERDANSRLQFETGRLIVTVFTLPASDTAAQRAALAARAFARYHRAYTSYTRAEAAISQQRDDHPLPAVPDGACR